MVTRREKRMLTRAEVSTVVILGLFVLAIVPLACRTAQIIDSRTVCAIHLSVLGKAMQIYANDYEDALPRAGGPTTTWGPTADWVAPHRYAAFGMQPGGDSGGSATISASFYLLVKYAEVAPKLFVCPDDTGTTEFKLADVSGAEPTVTLIDAWDFGPSGESWKHCSYAYHMPYGKYALTTSRDPKLAVAADRNPWIESPAAKAASISMFQPDVPPWNASDKMARAGNSPSHQKNGQNVLFLDGRVSFEIRSYCAGDEDNIYTISGNRDGANPLGIMPPTAQFSPSSDCDCVLVHDPPAFVSPVRVRPTRR